jgi:hypothetical protein
VAGFAHPYAGEFRHFAQGAPGVPRLRAAIAEQVPPDPQRNGAAVDVARDRGERRRGVARICLQHVTLQHEQQIAEVVHQTRREEGEVGSGCGSGRHRRIVP